MVQGMVMTMPDDAPINRFPSEEEQQAALNEFAREMRRVKERKESVPPETLNEALETISGYLKTGWSTGGGRRLRQFVWSLWNGFHLINLYDLSSGLDGRLTDAVIVVFNAAMVDALSEDQKRLVLKESGEFARWEQASAETPEDEEVLYPPFPMSTDGLRRVAHSAEQSDRRIEQQRHPVGRRPRPCTRRPEPQEHDRSGEPCDHPEHRVRGLGEPVAVR